MSQQSLLLIGGGHRPQVALKAWLQTSSAEPAKVMIITWASSIQAELETALQADFKQAGAQQFLSSQSITPENKAQFLLELKQATHIFFSGGDQKRIIDVVQDFDVRQALEDAYWNKAIPVGGTSAGTAAMADRMIQGDELPLLPGLGFLPNSVIDMHFFVRHREERLRAALKEVPDHFMGLGVDEDGALLLKRNPSTLGFKIEVLGEKNSLLIDQKINGARAEHLLQPQ